MQQKLSSIYDDYKRFQMDLEFVQLLANPRYIHKLALKGYLQDPQFINYLQYLLYFKRSEFIKYIQYPLCLKMLDCLQNAEFREQMKLYEFQLQIEQQLFITFNILQTK